MKLQLLVVLLVVLAAVPHAAIASAVAPAQADVAPARWACNDTGVIKESARYYRIGLNHIAVDILREAGGAVKAAFAAKLAQILGRRWLPAVLLMVSVPLIQNWLDRERNECGIYVHVAAKLPVWPVIWVEPQAP